MFMGKQNFPGSWELTFSWVSDMMPLGEITLLSFKQCLRTHKFMGKSDPEVHEHQPPTNIDDSTVACIVYFHI